MAYQIQMLRSRMDTDRIYTRPEERAELIRLGKELGHDNRDVMLVVKPATYRGWLRPKEEAMRPMTGRPGTAQATVNIVLQFATDNLTWGYKHLHSELKITDCEANGKRTER